jgi:hypothetical protein
LKLRRKPIALPNLPLRAANEIQLAATIAAVVTGSAATAKPAVVSKAAPMRVYQL